jgi:peptide/nickel transport system permease protein
VHFLLRRALGALALLWLIVTLTFVLLRAAPGDPAELMAPPGATAEDRTRVRAELGLDAPVPVQYARWLGRVLRGDLGESFAQRRPVTRVLMEALPVSLWLGGASLALTFLVGVAIGTAQALRRGSGVDTALTVLTTAVYAAPSYWLALALVAVFTYGASRWGFPLWLRLPAFGLRDPAGSASGFSALLDLARHAVLPVTVLAAIGAAGIARYARASVAELTRSEFVRTAYAKGLSRRIVVWRHLLANALPPLIVLLALSLPGVVAGSVFVESVFAWPGMGRILLTAIAARDFPVVLGATVLYGALVVCANLLADVALPLVDPRRRE